jgi:hypothetical protein
MQLEPTDNTPLRPIQDETWFLSLMGAAGFTRTAPDVFSRGSLQVRIAQAIYFTDSKINGWSSQVALGEGCRERLIDVVNLMMQGYECLGDEVYFSSASDDCQEDGDWDIELEPLSKTWFIKFMAQKRFTRCSAHSFIRGPLEVQVDDEECAFLIFDESLADWTCKVEFDQVSRGTIMAMLNIVFEGH